VEPARDRPEGSSEQAAGAVPGKDDQRTHADADNAAEAGSLAVESAKPHRMFRLVYLMGEQASSIDAELRVQLRSEIHELQQEFSPTTIYVTHDPAEAMRMGERVAVIGNGHLHQVDKPGRLYHWPANQFVATLIGSPAMNMAEAHLSRANDGFIVRFGGHQLVVDAEFVAERPTLLGYDGASLIVGIRPEDLEDAAFAADAPPERTLNVVVHFSIATTTSPAADASESSESTGENGSIFVARVDPRTTAREGEPLRLVVNTRRLHFFDCETGGAIVGESEHLRRASLAPQIDRPSDSVRVESCGPSGSRDSSLIVERGK
jgi:multiple sugar transport system ATP-binding protein